MLVGVWLLKASVLIPLGVLCAGTILCNGIISLQIAVLIYVCNDKHIRKLKGKLNHATSITEYAAVACELDRKLGLDLWKRDVKSHGYDFHRVQLWSKALAVYLESNALDRLCEVLLQSQKNHHGGTLGPAVYSYTFWNTKDCITQYHRQLIKSLEFVTEAVLAADTPNLKVFSFAHQFGLLWGKSVLAIHGQRSSLYFNYGVCKGLLHLKCVPNVIYASEANCIIAAWLTLNADTGDDDFRKDDETMVQIIGTIRKKYKWYNMQQKERKGLLDLLSSLFGDITLLESYNLSGRQLNLINQFRLDQLVIMNYKSCPETTMTSAILACLCSDILQPTPIHAVAASSCSHHIKEPVSSLWGVVLTDDRQRSWLLDEGNLHPGCPRDQLLGTAGRELINTMYTIRQMLQDTSLQLWWTVSSTMGWNYRASSGSCFGHSAEPSSCATTADASATSLFGGNHRSTVVHHPHINGTKIVIAPPKIVCPVNSVRYACSKDFQMGQGLKRAYQHACLIKTRLETERTVHMLLEACQIEAESS